MTPRSRAVFRPHERIKNPEDFRRAFERRRSASDHALIVHGVENGRDHPRLGISVPRRRVRSAVARNRIKRLIREAFRLSKSELPAGVDLVVLPRAIPLSFEATAIKPLLLRAIGALVHGPGRLVIAVLIGGIRIYQLTISPMLGRACRFEPSCSRYMAESLRKYGLIRGFTQGTRRILRCHPWNPGGYDPP
jgi:putative membrane protein insertion efficiency factor/ribonuclease P protein component